MGQYLEDVHGCNHAGKVGIMFVEYNDLGKDVRSRGTRSDGCLKHLMPREHLYHHNDEKGVAGGGSGIGRATCQLLARDGARVVVTDVNLKAARETQSLMPGKNV